MENAYMLRRDGRAYPVTVHLYGSADDPEETLFAAEWLYDHTANQSTKESIVKFVASYAKFLDPDLSAKEIVPTLSYQFKHLGYRVLSSEFISKISDNLEKLNLESVPSVQSMNDYVNTLLNEEFTRVRYGGMFDSDFPAGKEIYFRISSTGFNWFNTIWQFVYDRKSQIDYVTIVKDPESTGHDGFYYKLPEGVANHMFVKDFLYSKGNPVVDSKYNLLETQNLERRRDLRMRAHVKDLANYEKGKAFAK